MRLGTRIGGTAKATGLWTLVLLKYDDVPGFPGESGVMAYGLACPTLTPTLRLLWRVPHKPAAPLLDAANSTRQNLHLTARAYRNTMIAHVGRCSHFHGVSAQNVLADPSHADVLPAVSVLLRDRIAPHAWSAFSLEVWTKYVRARNSNLPLAPPPKWVFSLKRLEERLEWFGWFENFSAGKEAEICDEHKTLANAYVHMRRKIVRLGHDQLIAHFEDAGPRRKVRECATHYYQVLHKLSPRIADTYKQQEKRWEESMKQGAWIW